MHLLASSSYSHLAFNHIHVRGKERQDQKKDAHYTLQNITSLVQSLIWRVLKKLLAKVEMGGHVPDKHKEAEGLKQSETETKNEVSKTKGVVMNCRNSHFLVVGASYEEAKHQEGNDGENAPGTVDPEQSRWH
jgi:hypothetical protein